MLNTATRPLTAEDYRELPEGPPYAQLVEGDFYMAPSPNLFHQDIVLYLARVIGNYLDDHPRGSVHIAPSDVQLSDLNVFQPDLYFVANARRSILTEQGTEGAPNLIVEVISPRTERLDRDVKKHVYARAGVEELWIVDPLAKEISVYRFEESAKLPVAVLRPGKKLSTPLLPNLHISVTRIFRQ